MASNQEILRKNKEILDLIDKLQFTYYQDKSIEDVESLLSRAHQLIENYAGKEKIVGFGSNAAEKTRIKWAIEGLKHTLKRIREPSYSPKKKEQPSPSTGLPTPSSGPSGSGTTAPSSTSPGPTSQTPPPPAYTGPTMPLRPSAATGKTTRLATGDTRRLATQPLSETDIQPATGKTKRLQTQKLSNDTTVTGATTDLSGQVIYKSQGSTLAQFEAARIAESSQAKYYQTKRDIENITNNQFERIKAGDAGTDWRQAALETPEDVQELVHRNVSDRHWGDYVRRYKEEASDFESDFEVAKAIDWRDASEEQLQNEKLLDTQLLNDDRFSQYYTSSSTGVNATVHDTRSILDRPLTKQEYIEKITLAQKEVLHRFNEQQPDVAQTLALPQRLREVPRTPLPQAQTPFADDVLTQLKQRATGRITESLNKKTKEQITEKLTGKSGTTVIADKATAVLAKRFGATLGSAIGPLGTALGYAIGWIAGKVAIPLYKAIRRRAPELAGAGLLLLGGAALLGNAFIGALGAGLFGLSLAGGGPTALLASTSAIAAALWAFFMAVIFSAIILPILISIGTIIVLVAFILFIINNSGYLTPFVEEGLTTTYTPGPSLYIEVVKTPLPKLTYTNNELPITVTYKIDIKALGEDLTDISYDNAYTITQNPTVATPPSVALPDSAGTIPAGQTRTFTYTVTYGAEFKDASVCDNFKVSATAGATRDSATTFACVNIGSAPADCPSGWPVQTAAGQKYGINQGPNGSASHRGLEAVDVQLYPINRSLRPDDVAMTTHKGVISNIHHWDSTNCHPLQGVCPDAEKGGNYITVQGMCNGVPFRSYYGHLTGFSSGLRIGDPIDKGTVVGIIGNTGWALSGPHIHYMFLGLRMMSPNIPINGDSLRNCVGFTQCNVFIP